MKTDRPPRSSRPCLRALGWRISLLAAALAPALVSAQTPTREVVCHYTYGGETKALKAQPVASPYAVPAIQVGSYFMLRVVWQTRPAEHAAVNIYTYADGNDGPVIIHHAAFPASQLRGARYGFTGLQRVYEPMRDGELEYWCEMTAVKGPQR